MSQSQEQTKPTKPLVGYVLVNPCGELAEMTIVSDDIDYLRRAYASSLDYGYRIAKVCEVTE